MDEELEKLYLQNIEEYIFDEDKIVTYKWLSTSLNIHVNTAKQLLYTFITEIDADRKAELHLTYLVGGLLYDGKGCKFQVVREDNLEKVKNQFKVVTSEHIYSIHKSKQLPDLSILYTIDHIKESEDGNRKMQGTIQCKKSVRRLEEQLAELRLQARAAAVCTDGKQWPAASKSNLQKKQENSEQSSAGEKKTKPGSISTLLGAQGNKPKSVENSDQKMSDSMETPQDTKKSKTSGSIASMFSAQSSKKKAENSERKNSNSKESVRETSKLKGSGSIINMFAAQSKKPKSVKSVEPEQTPKDLSNDSESSEPVQVKIIENDNKGKMKNSERKDESAEKSSGGKRKHKTNEKAKAKSKSKKSKQSTSEEDMQLSKKRRRILAISDSESSDDDMFGKEEEEVQVELEPEPEMVVVQESDTEDVIPSTPQEAFKKGKKRKRKMVDETIVDEDGYINTTKKYVYVSCSESEAEEEKENERIVVDKVGNNEKEGPKSEVNGKASKSVPKKKNSPKKKPSPPQKAKQMTLTNFFKKS